MTEEDRLTVAQAARELGLSVRAVQYRLREGLLHGTNYGGRIWLIPREAVEQAKRSGRLKPGRRPLR